MLVHLASTSPRRRALLRAAGIEHRLVDPGPEPTAEGAPEERALARARSKALGAARADGLVVGVDTVVDVDGEELGKPADGAEAARMLERLQGRTHRVHTAVCVRRDGRVWSAVATSVVRMAEVDEARVREHVASELWRGKAGGYGIQDPDVAAFTEVVDGEVDTVIGLPVRLLRELLDAARSEAS